MHPSTLGAGAPARPRHWSWTRRAVPATQAFWTFLAVCRDALDRLEAAQIKDRPLFEVQVADLAVHGAGGVVGTVRDATRNATA
jgi:hypothetical protein